MIFQPHSRALRVVDKTHKIDENDENIGLYYISITYGPKVLNDLITQLFALKVDHTPYKTNYLFQIAQRKHVIITI